MIFNIFVFIARKYLYPFVTMNERKLLFMNNLKILEEIPLSLKLALIGAGYIAEEHLKAIDAIEGLEVNTIYSRTLSKAKSLSKNFQFIRLLMTWIPL